MFKGFNSIKGLSLRSMMKIDNRYLYLFDAFPQHISVECHAILADSFSLLKVVNLQVWSMRRSQVLHYLSLSYLYV